jgi:hypothetical protein
MEHSVLRVLSEYGPCGEYFIYTKTVMKKTGLSRIWSTAILKSLRNKGLVKYQTGLFTDYGMTAGSGYGLTNKGIKYVQDFKIKNQ